MCVSPIQAVVFIQKDIRTAEVSGNTTHKTDRPRMQAASYVGQPWRSREAAVLPEAEDMGSGMLRKACQLLMLAEAC